MKYPDSYEEFHALGSKGQMEVILDMVKSKRLEGKSWEVVMAETEESLQFATRIMVVLKGPELVNTLLIEMLMDAYELLVRRELGEEQ